MPIGTILLAATPAIAHAAGGLSLVDIITALLPYASIILALWSLMRKESKEDKLASEARLKDIEEKNRHLLFEQQNSEKRVEGFSRQIERMGDDFSKRFVHYDGKFQKVDELIVRLERFEERMSNSIKTNEKLDAKVDQLLKELRNDK